MRGVVLLLVLCQAIVGQRLAKRGAAWFEAPTCEDLTQMGGVAWWYNWAPNPTDNGQIAVDLGACSESLGLQFVPMQWGERDIDLLEDRVDKKATHLLGFNEPNFHEQANLTPERAAQLWPKVQAVADKYNMKLGSPCPAWCGTGCHSTDPIDWLEAFFRLCPGCRVDFVTTHFYTDNAQWVMSEVARLRRFNRPVWITEFARPSAGQPVTNTMSFMHSLLNGFDNDVHVDRYAWFGTRIRDPGHIGWLGKQVEMLHGAEPRLSDLGQLYNAITTTVKVETTTGLTCRDTCRTHPKVRQNSVCQQAYTIRNGMGKWVHCDTPLEGAAASCFCDPPTQCKAYMSGMEKKYGLFRQTGPGATRVEFEVQAGGNSYVSLAVQPNEAEISYEICIGGWGNTRSFIRRCVDCWWLPGDEMTPGLLDPSEYRKFWLSWEGGHIKVGRGGEATPFLQWKDPTPLPVAYVGYSTGFGESGRWMFCPEANEQVCDKTVCTALDQCHEAGKCDSKTGKCDNPPKPDGTQCDDGSDATYDDTCNGGVCSGATPSQICKLEDGIDYEGADIKNVRTDTPDLCCLACKQTIGCGAWTWIKNPYAGDWYKRCYLKSNGRDAKANGDVMSGVVTPARGSAVSKDSEGTSPAVTGYSGAVVAGACVGCAVVGAILGAVVVTAIRHARKASATRQHTAAARKDSLLVEEDLGNEELL